MFQDKSVLVTGAASGIGRATARRFAREGARLALADRDAAGLAVVAREVGGAATFLYDAADGEASAAMAAAASNALNGLDAVICNAGLYRRTHFADMSPADWSMMIAVNLTSVVRIVQASLPALLASRGNVVSVASTAADRGIAYAAHYAAAKAGVVALTRSLAVEFAAAGLRFNAVAPGKVKTAIGVGLAPLARQNDSLLVRAPRLAGCADGGEPDDLAGAIAFLASDDARYVSGDVLVVDGAQNIG
jgi:NAD(P)-dependent dehydrogenase (short-subunit alcohol dehydrogenase family)